ncbi:MAG: hypothetical protein AAF125_11330, partial [Chloroflexota bacterium]
MLQRLRQWFVKRFWFVFPHFTMLIDLGPNQLYAMLQEAAKPSKDRLHLQEVFLSGRRYRIEQRDGVISVVTTSKSYWRYTEGLLSTRRRTRSAAKLVLLTEV